MITSAGILSRGCSEFEIPNYAGKTDYFCEKGMLLYYSILTLSVRYLHQRSMLNRLRSKKLKVFEILL